MTAIVGLLTIEHEHEPRLAALPAVLSQQLYKGGRFANVLGSLKAKLARADDVLSYLIGSELHCLGQNLIFCR